MELRRRCVGRALGWLAGTSVLLGTAWTGAAAAQPAPGPAAKTAPAPAAPAPAAPEATPPAEATAPGAAAPEATAPEATAPEATAPAAAAPEAATAPTATAPPPAPAEAAPTEPTATEPSAPEAAAEPTPQAATPAADATPSKSTPAATKQPVLGHTNTEVGFRRRGPAYSAVEVQALFLGEMLPKPFFGIDVAYAVGNENFYLRVGGAFAGSPVFQLADTKVANTLQYGQADVCAGKSVYHHRIRMCLGGEAGAWRHIWKSSIRPGRKWTPHVGGTLKADYTYEVTERFGVMFGVGVVVPVIGPSFQGRDQFGRPSALVIPGPVAGSMRLGVLARFR